VAGATILGEGRVVLILDAHPSAREANRASAEVVREVVAARTPPVPVFVQVNKTDHPEALRAAEVDNEAAQEWPWLSASAEAGQEVRLAAMNLSGAPVEILGGAAHDV
jgi:50S ribosomal subunit-associated GTPase HflX